MASNMMHNVARVDRDGVNATTVEVVVRGGVRVGSRWGRGYGYGWAVGLLPGADRASGRREGTEGRKPKRARRRGGNPGRWRGNLARSGGNPGRCRGNPAKERRKPITCACVTPKSKTKRGEETPAGSYLFLRKPPEKTRRGGENRFSQQETTDFGPPCEMDDITAYEKL